MVWVSQPGRLWFVVMQRAGRESPALYHDYLPSWVTGKHAKDYGVVYVELLGDSRRDMSLPLLWDHYRRMKAYREANERHPLPLSGTGEGGG
jgi:hypothetical protein